MTSVSAKRLIFCGPKIAAYATGALCGAGAIFGLLGEVAGVSASAIALAFLPAAIIALLCSAQWQPPPAPAAIPAAAALTTLVFVIFNASPSQWQFLFSPSQWSSRNEFYVESKLLMFAISFVPQAIFAATLLVVADRRRVVDGALFAFAFVATAAAVRVLGEHGATLLGTDHATARKFFLDEERAFSTVSYGALMLLGAVSAFRFKAGWVLAGFLLFMTALLSRRGDTISLLAVFLSISAISYLLKREWKKYLGASIVAIFLFLPLHNGHNLHNFFHLAEAAQTRVDILLPGSPTPDVAGETTTPQPPPQATPSPLSTATIPLSAPDSSASSPLSQLVGRGLGSYERLSGTGFNYPHNIVVEATLELGLLAGISTALVFLAPLAWTAAAIGRRKISDPALYAAASLLLLFLLSMKAGDLTYLGRAFFVATLTMLALSLWRPVEDV